jgi:hypothetical protein
MSFQDGWDALNLRMPARIPRTEYSAESHWDLIAAVTGIAATAESPAPLRDRARRAFYEAWHYDFFWSTLVHGQPIEVKRTRMGHAEYAAGGADRDDRVGCPFRDADEALAFDPMETYGPCDAAEWTRRFEAHYRDNCAAHPDGVNMTGIYITCVSGLIEILGWDLLLAAAGEDPAAFGRLTDRYTAWMQGWFDALAAADVPVVMVHDDIVWTSGPFMAPAWYREHVFPAYQRYFAPLRDTGKKIVYTSDGNYTLFVDDVVAAGAHALVLEPVTDLRYVADRYGRTHAFIGNADTRILLSGTKEGIRREVERCMAIGRDCPGFFLAVGNHIPANTPVENALYYNACYEELMPRRR